LPVDGNSASTTASSLIRVNMASNSVVLLPATSAARRAEFPKVRSPHQSLELPRDRRASMKTMLWTV
jgi:hypothetical protein